MFMAGDLGTVNGLRSSLGLDAVSSPVELLARSVVTTVAELDGGGPYPAGVTLVGPLADVGPPAAGGPVVVANLGTTPMDEGPVLTRLVEALGELGEPALVTVGSHLDPAAFPAPAGVTVSGYVPHASVLPGARLFVGHGGLSGIGAALAHGVPMVCVPLGRDQPDNAARVAAVGAGLLRPGSAPAAELHAAMATVLRDPSFAAAAGRLRDAIPAPPVAVAAVEAVLR
jgi:UDP:flavonoid glycosyltransferase YjiC (YdhE family)